MMKRLIGLFVVALTVTVGFAQGFQSYTFEEIKWLSAPAVVAAKLEAEGYTVATPELDEQDTLAFSGPLLGNRVRGTAHFAEQQLLKIDLAFPPQGAVNLAATEAVYNQLRDTLVGRYGPPAQETNLTTAWFTEEIGGYVGGVLLEVQGDAEVFLTYESPRWAFHLAEAEDGGVDAF
jgi:hypothetical protein